MEPRSRSSRFWPLGGRATALLLAACVATGVAGGFVLHATSMRPHAASETFPAATANTLSGDAVWPAGARPAPPFVLRDQLNRPVALPGQRGRAVLLAFMDSHCTQDCKLEGPVLGDALRQAGTRRPVTLLVVSVNPWQDTAASSRSAAARYRLGGDWHWLRGSLAELRPVWRAYAIEVVRTPTDVNHSTAIYLLDGRGYERAGFNFPFAASQVARDLRRLGRPPTT
ncbi:MAG TPA: SCO family protein [Conexibacter sp.]|nr:SCO family protein [Conexibacter sp.]